MSGKLLYQIHQHLKEVFSPLKDMLFGGKSVLVCGNLYQLTPIEVKTLFMFNETEIMEGFFVARFMP